MGDEGRGVGGTGKEGLGRWSDFSSSVDCFWYHRDLIVLSVCDFGGRDAALVGS